MNGRLGLVLIATLLAASAARAAAPVYDPSSQRLDRIEQQISNANSDSLADQVRQLQEEVQTLRGMVEVNEHQISQLKDRQRDFYTDLDSRINELKTGPSSVATPSSVTPPASSPIKPEASSAEQSMYHSAHDLMQEKHYDQAIAAFDQYLKKYPQGRFAPNAYYWMGETQLLTKDLDAAKIAFQNIVTQFPTHQKSADALLKLGYVYDAAGQKDKALKTLNEVTQKYPGSTLARIAEQRILQIKQRS